MKISQQNQLISKRTKNILKKLDERGSSKNINRVSVKILSALKKGEVKVKDLGKLQAATHDEYTLLRGPGKYGERVLIRGTPNQVGIPEEYIQKEYVWSGHSHPDDTSPSQYDRNALSAFAQEYSVIVSACQSLESKYKKFDQIEDWSSWLP